ncbi:MAG: hypothetical protein V1646_04165 [bacterium]
MQVNVSLKFLCFIFLLLIIFNLKAVELNNDTAFPRNDAFLAQVSSTHKNTLYDGKKFIFYANPSFIYMLGAAGIAAILLAGGVLLIHDSFDKRKNHGPWGKFLTGLGAAGLGGVSVKLFFDAINMKINQFEYIKFDEVGIYKWGQLQAKWEDISDIYLSKTYYNDTPTKRVSFSDKRLNDIFVIKDSDNFLPVGFDDFLSISEYYLTKPKSLPPQA